MAPIAAFIIAVGIIVGLILGIWWAIWSLWCFVIPSVWTAAPESIAHPDYWVFAGMWVLLGLIGRLLFKREAK